MKRILVAFLLVVILAGAVLGQGVQQINFSAPAPSGMNSQDISLQVTGTPGSQKYFYWIVVDYPIGSAFPGGPQQISRVPDTLSVTNYVKVSWSPKTGATGYDVLRTTSEQMPSGSCNCAVVVNTTATTVNDTSNALLGYTISSTGVMNGVLRLDNQSYAAPYFVLTPSIQNVPIISTGVGIPAINCTQGKDIYYDTVGATWYFCAPANMWVRVGTPAAAIVDLWANRPNICLTNDQFYAKDAGYNSICTAPNTWTTFYGGWLATPPAPNVTWTQVNFGTSTVSDENGAVTIIPQAPPVDFQYYLRGEIKTSPSAPYSLYGHFTPVYNATGKTYTGVWLRESGTGKLFTCSSFYTNTTNISHNLLAQRWDKPDNGTPVTVGTQYTASANSYHVFGFKIDYDGTNVSCSAQDGNKWIPLATVLKTVPFTVAPDQYGFFAAAPGPAAEAQLPVVTFWDVGIR